MTADTIFLRATLWSGGAVVPGATALAVAGGRIVAVGRDADVAPLRGAHTRVVDAAGATLLPGFVDAHAHIWKIGHLLTTLLDLRDSQSLDDLGARVRSRAARLPRGAWLYGRGFNETRFPERRVPTRDDLDAVAPDRPVVLMRTCAHIIVCNSAALQLAGLDDATADPPGGELGRDATGRLTGVVSERALGLVLPSIPAPTTDDYEAMIEAALRHQATLGITATSDTGVAPDLLAVYRRLDAAGRLPLRVNVMALRTIDGEGPAPLPEICRTDHLRIDTVKFFGDGGLSSATAALSEPYRHSPSQGVLRMDDDEFLALADDAHRAGLRLATHAIGDVAIEQVLRVYAALGEGPVRHRIEHFGLPGPSHLREAARQRVIVVPQSIFLHELGRNFRQYLPDSYLPRTYPIRSMIDAGLTVALSSDAPVVVDDAPLAGMQAALCRRDADGEVLAPAEAITLHEALEAYTHAGAVASGDAHQQGLLRAGYRADLVLVDGHMSAWAPETLAAQRIRQTWVGGTCVHDA